MNNSIVDAKLGLCPLDAFGLSHTAGFPMLFVFRDDEVWLTHLSKNDPEQRAEIQISLPPGLTSHVLKNLDLIGFLQDWQESRPNVVFDSAMVDEIPHHQVEQIFQAEILCPVS